MFVEFSTGAADLDFFLHSDGNGSKIAEESRNARTTKARILSTDFQNVRLPRPVYPSQTGPPGPEPKLS